MSERKPKEARTSGGSVTVALPAFTFLGRPSNTAFPYGDIVYFMYSGGRIKIGYSAGLRGRHKRLRASGPFQPVVFLVMPGTTQDEQGIHLKFKAERLHGEWFTLSDRLRAYLYPKLCDQGKTSLDRAEAEFKTYCEEIVAAYRAPPIRRPRPICVHGVSVACPDCERERDLKILDDLRSRVRV